MIEFLVASIPLLVLFAALLLGRYPGCEAAMRLAARIATRARSIAAGLGNWSRPHPPASHAARGGLLLAFGLSGRAPPA